MFQIFSLYSMFVHKFILSVYDKKLKCNFSKFCYVVPNLLILFNCLRLNCFMKNKIVSYFILHKNYRVRIDSTFLKRTNCLHWRDWSANNIIHESIIEFIK